MSHIRRPPHLPVAQGVVSADRRRAASPPLWRACELLGIPPETADLFLPAPHPLRVGKESGVSVSLRTLDALLSEIPRAVIPAALARATRQRWLAFIAGRLAAARALAELGGEPLWLARGDQGEPVWPDGFRGSITHAGTLATALATPSRRGRLVGIDSEIVVSPTVATEILPLSATAAERARGGAWEPWQVTLCFAAKEAYFKAIHAQVGRFIDFDEVEVDFEPTGPNLAPATAAISTTGASAVVGRVRSGRVRIRPCEPLGDLRVGQGRFHRDAVAVHVTVDLPTSSRYRRAIDEEASARNAI